MKSFTKIIFILFVFINWTTLLYSQTYPTITEINPSIKEIMEKVDIDLLEYNIRHLQNLGPRPADGTDANFPYQNNIAAKNWLYQQYQTIGNLDVYLNHFLPPEKCDTIWQDWISDTAFLTVDTARNVVAVQTGTEKPAEYIVVCSHFDTGPIGAGFMSPGADDNASGTSGVIELARVLSKYKFKRSVIYLNNNGEEIGVSGASLFAHYCKENNINILGVFNLDMIGYIPIGKGLEVFYDTILTNNPLDDDELILTTREFGKYFGNVANLYLPNIPVMPGRNNGGGDCTMFRLYDYPAMYMGDILGGMFDIYMNPCYHQECDTIGIGKQDAGVNSMELVKAYTQAVLVAIAELAELDEVSILENNFITNLQMLPNPANSTTMLSLDLEKADNLQITLTNITGQEVLQLYNSFVEAGPFTHTFSVADLPLGTYFIRLQLGDNSKYEKLIVK